MMVPRDQTDLGMGSGLSHENRACQSRVDATKPQASHGLQQVMASVAMLSSGNPGAQEQRVGSLIVVVWESPVPRVHSSKVAAWCKTQDTEGLRCSEVFY